MNTHNREILIYYNASSSPHKKTVAYAKSVVPHVKPYDFAKAPSTDTSWRMIIKALDVHPKDLLNKAHPDYQNHIRGREFDSEGWLKILKYNPELIKAPIAIRGKKAIICTTPTDILKLVEKEITTA